jgi:restriction endonuclease Mrr
MIGQSILTPSTLVMMAHLNEGRLRDIDAQRARPIGKEADEEPPTNSELLPSGKQPRFNNRVGWTTTYLKKAGLLRAVGPGRFQLTDRGRDVLASPPTSIDVSFLESRFPEMLEFRKAGSRGEVVGEEPPATFNTANGTWGQRGGVQERVREMLELSIQDVKQRLQTAISQIAPVRNEIAHVREVERDRLLRASVASADVLEILRGSSSQSGT